jgi:hypothetical protein
VDLCLPVGAGTKLELEVLYLTTEGLLGSIVNMSALGYLRSVVVVARTIDDYDEARSRQTCWSRNRAVLFLPCPWYLLDILDLAAVAQRDT